MTLRSPVVATAGHVDHGKSTLVKALTGIDPDRLAEEKRRGLTIELGFVTVDLGELGRASLVDVPGHERFTSTMLAGVAVIDAVLLCVDAAEGWRAQTEEHLRIVDLAGVPAGVIVLTKASTVSEDCMAQREAEVGQRVAGTVFAGAPVVACDAVTGRGLDRVRSELCRVLAPLPPPVDRGRPRLWVDRSFTIAGAGTVVTGGVTHGTFTRGEPVDVLTASAIRPARIRGIQCLGETVELAHAGSRAALSLPQVSPSSVGRGDAIVHGGDWQLVRDFDATVTALTHLGRPLTARGAFLAYLGTEELAVTFRPLGGGRIEPGDTGPVRIRLPRRLPLAAGDRFVLRDAGRRAIVGGGVISDVRSVRREGPTAGWVDAAAADRAAIPATGTRVGPWTVDDPALKAATVALTERLEAARALGLDLQALGSHDRDLCRWMESQGSAVVQGGYAIAPAWCAELEEHPYLAALRRSPFRPPAPGGASVAGDELRALARRGLAVQRHGVWFAAEALVAAADLLRSRLEEPFSVSSARQALGTSRRCVVPLLELLDASGTTSRSDAGRRFRNR